MAIHTDREIMVKTNNEPLATTRSRRKKLSFFKISDKNPSDNVSFRI